MQCEVLALAFLSDIIDNVFLGIYECLSKKFELICSPLLYLERGSHTMCPELNSINNNLDVSSRESRHGDRG